MVGIGRFSTAGSLLGLPRRCHRRRRRALGSRRLGRLVLRVLSLKVLKFREKAVRENLSRNRPSTRSTHMSMSKLVEGKGTYSPLNSMVGLLGLLLLNHRTHLE